MSLNFIERETKSLLLFIEDDFNFFQLVSRMLSREDILKLLLLEGEENILISTFYLTIFSLTAWFLGTKHSAEVVSSEEIIV